MGNSASALPYEAVAPLEYPGPASYWSLSSGTKKEDKEEKEQVTIFRFAKSAADKAQVSARSLQKLRTIKHPFILSFLDAADLEDSLLLVTESCIPLEVWIQQQKERLGDDSEQLAQEVIWGFRCVVNALQFLNSTCSLMHGYLGLHAIFVSKNGDWKLGALDLACNLANSDDVSFFNTYNHLLTSPFISPERLQPNAATTLQPCPGAADIFSLAHCIQTTFNKLQLEIPANFDKYLQRMLVVDVKRRPTAGQLAQCPIFNSEQVKLFISLGDLAIKPPADSLEILGNLSSRVSEIPRAVCIHKILPSVSRALQMVVNDFPTRNARESCRQSVQLSLSLLAQLASQNKLDESNYANKCLPVIIQLWSMNDRAIRTTLLKTLKSLIVLTPATFVNKNIFDPMLAGFADSNAKMREDTLKNLVHVVDKLDEKHLQDKLTRCISNLQNDSESSIRTNATIFLGRIASRLKEGVRTRVIAPAFAKAMRDPFVHCRLAGLKAAVACIELLDIPQLTGKIMPQACTLLVDRSGEVREMSLSLLDASATILRQYHERTLQADKLAAANAAAAASGAGNGQQQQNQQDASGPASLTGGGSTWTSWVSDGLSKTIEKVATVSDDSAVDKLRQNAVSSSSGLPTSGGGGSSSSSSGNLSSRATSSSNVSIDNDSSFIGTAPDDGWGDDNWGVDDDDDDDKRERKGSGWGGDDDLDLDDDDGQDHVQRNSGDDAPPARPSSLALSGGGGKVGTLGASSSQVSSRPTSSSFSASTSAKTEPSGVLSIKSKAAKPAIISKKLSKDSETGASNDWDSW